MGNSGNIYVRNMTGSGVYLNTRWGGSDLPHILQSALKKGGSRWDDEIYLAKIIFCEMIKGNETTVKGGFYEAFGIGSYLQDNDHNILVVDCINQIVGVAIPGYEKEEVHKWWSFKQFCRLNAKILNILGRR